MKKFVLVLLMIGVMLVSGVFTTLAAEEINVIYMAQAAYQPNEIRDMADLFEELSGIKVNLEFVKYDEQHEKVVASAVAPIPTLSLIHI